MTFTDFIPLVGTLVNIWKAIFGAGLHAAPGFYLGQFAANVLIFNAAMPHIVKFAAWLVSLTPTQADDHVLAKIVPWATMAMAYAMRLVAALQALDVPHISAALRNADVTVHAVLPAPAPTPEPQKPTGW